jgi:hypothetical protein
MQSWNPLLCAKTSKRKHAEFLADLDDAKASLARSRRPHSSCAGSSRAAPTAVMESKSRGRSAAGRHRAGARDAERIRLLKLDELRPIEALQLLSELQEELKRSCV